jgi:hypothetical protein
MATRKDGWLQSARVARLLRIEQAGAWYDLTDRGNEQRLTFRDDRGREHFLGCLPKGPSVSALGLDAYVLMWAIAVRSNDQTSDSRTADGIGII